VSVSLSLDLDGSMTGNATSLTGRADLINVFNSSFSVSTFLAFASTGLGSVTGTTSLPAIDAQLTTVSGTAVVGQGYVLELRLTGLTYVNSGSSATLDFLHTLGFPSDRPVFNLPDGYTANAGDYLVNNRFVGATTPPAAVPEPGTLTLVGMSIAGVWIARWRRT
jgi:hypothetical protein